MLVFSFVKCSVLLRATAGVPMFLGTSMLDLIELLLGRYGIQHLRYDGKMGREAREKSLSTFKKTGGPRVILIRYAL